jgi:hypothetical protein
VIGIVSSLPEALPAEGLNFTSKNHAAMVAYKLSMWENIADAPPDPILSIGGNRNPRGALRSVCSSKCYEEKNDVTFRKGLSMYLKCKQMLGGLTQTLTS